MAQNSSGYTIEDVYRGVMNDVINHVKEAFLDENVDIDVLQQLKQLWESKVRASGAVNLDGYTLTQVRGPSTKPMSKSLVTTNAPTNSASIRAPMVYDNKVQQSVSVPLVAEVDGSKPTPMFVNLTQLSENILNNRVPLQFQGGRSTDSDGSMFLNIAQLPGNFANANRMPMPSSSTPVITSTTEVESTAQLFLLNQQHQEQLSQQQTQQVQRQLQPAQQQQQQQRRDPSTIRITQLDGGGPGMSDSSTSEEENDDDAEVDKLRRFQNLENEKLEEGDGAEEDPLNSDDDQSDDEDLETLFDADNIVVCQFEKVHRARNKWKFTLKDGIMRIDGEEYCFQKCAGEAEW